MTTTIDNILGNKGSRVALYEMCKSMTPEAKEAFLRDMQNSFDANRPKDASDEAK